MILKNWIIIIIIIIITTISHGNRTEWRTIQGVIGLVIISNLLSNYEPDYSGSQWSVKNTTCTQSDKWYKHEPLKSSHIVIKTIRIKKRTLVDVVIRSNKNTSTKVSEKLSKYEDLQIEITRMWQMKTEITTGSQVRYDLILDASAVL